MIPPAACENKIAGTTANGSKPPIISTGDKIVPYNMPREESMNSQAAAARKIPAADEYSIMISPYVKAVIISMRIESKISPFVNSSLCVLTNASGAFP